MENKTPVLIAYPRRAGPGLKVWCPFCVCWHHHGTGEGHRTAHCKDDTPFSKTGYVLKLAVRNR